MSRTLIWCVGIGLAVAIGAFAWLGVRPWTIALALFLLACPAVVVWGAIEVRRGGGARRAKERMSDAGPPRVDRH